MGLDLAAASSLGTSLGAVRQDGVEGLDNAAFVFHEPGGLSVVDVQCRGGEGQGWRRRCREEGYEQWLAQECGRLEVLG